MTKQQHIVSYIHEKVWGVSNLDCLIDKKNEYCILYIHEKVWGVSNLDCLHTMDWMSGEGHTGVVRCLQVDDRDQPWSVDVDHGNVDVVDDQPRGVDVNLDHDDVEDGDDLFFCPFDRLE